MKTIFTLLSGFLLSFTLMAAPSDFDWKERSMLTVKSMGQGDIRVVVDGKRFEPRKQSMTIRNIQTGYHNVKIYRQKSDGFFNKFKSQYELIFNKSVMVKKHANLVITIDRMGRHYIDQQKTKGNGNSYGWNKQQNNDRDFERNKDFDKDREYEKNRDFDRDMKSDDDNYEFDFDKDGHNGDFDNDYGYDNRNFKAINDREFSNVLQSVKKEWFEGNKVKSASQVISGNYFTSSQVKQLLQLFTFENNKLDLAKQAYSKTVDPGRYMSVVGDVFSFNSSRDELSRFIRGNQR